MRNMSTDKKIIVKENKSLKLTNVLIRELINTELMNINKVTYMMESYIKNKGNSIIGPLINYSSMQIGENGENKLVYKILIQLKNPMHSVESPYIYEPQIKINNCLYTRFSEKETNLQFAFSKLHLHAYESDLKLVGDSYTVFVDRKESLITADIFMQLVDGGNSLANI